MNFDIIENRRKQIQNWIVSIKECYQKVIDNKTELEIVQLVRALNLEMLDFKEFYLPTLDLVIDIASGSQGAYKALGLQPPTEYNLILFDNEVKVDMSSKEREDIAYHIFPELKEAYQTFQEVLGKYEKIQEILVIETRARIKQLFDAYEIILKRIEKQVRKSSSPLAEDLISGLTEMRLMEKRLKEEIAKNSIGGQDLWRKSLGKRYSIENELLDSFPSPNLFSYYKVSHNRSPMLSENILTQELQERNQTFEQRFQAISKSIKNLQEKTQHSYKMYEVLDQLNPEFPINLERLAELAGLDKNLTERTLEFVLEITPEIGKYDQMSQMLVFDKPEKVRKAVRSKKRVFCPECKSKLKSTVEKCPNCGKEFDICPICRGTITTETTKSCSSCGRLFHKNHLEEWMNTNSNCPICKKKL